MKTSYDAGTGIALANVALQALTDVKESARGGLGSKVSIIVVKGTVPQAHIDRLSSASAEAHEAIHKDKKSSKSQGTHAHSICFASLPNTGDSGVWRRLSHRSYNDGGFCKYVELLATISLVVVTGKFVRAMLLSLVDPSSE
ncbi:unnamed protein product [Alternaria alternata]